MLSHTTTLRQQPRAGTLIDRTATRLVLQQLQRWHTGALTIELPDGQRLALGPADAARLVTVSIRDWRFFRRALLGGDIGIGEAYMDGEWACSDLVALCRMFIEDQSVLDARTPWTLAARLRHAWRRLRQANTIGGSRRNIHHHYDLGNELFALFLDPSMTYSAAVFPHPQATLAEAQVAKLHGICRALGLRPGAHVLEIGSGWGSFAIHAARTCGVRVTTVTLSAEQQRLARERAAAAGVADRVDVQLCDYRHLRGRFDHIVSIEMFEAVGLAFYDAYFSACERLLAPGGGMFLQAIAIPDQRFDAYRRDYDWLRKYIFPGSELASLHAITGALKRVTRLRVASLTDIGADYARTLRCWREQFLARRDAVRRLGYDDRFIRMWEFYLASCEAAFASGYLTDLQLVLRRPQPYERQAGNPARRLAA